MIRKGGKGPRGICQCLPTRKGGEEANATTQLFIRGGPEGSGKKGALEATAAAFATVAKNFLSPKKQQQKRRGGC